MGNRVEELPNSGKGARRHLLCALGNRSAKCVFVGQNGNAAPAAGSQQPAAIVRSCQKRDGRGEQDSRDMHRPEQARVQDAGGGRRAGWGRAGQSRAPTPDFQLYPAGDGAGGSTGAGTSSDFGSLFGRNFGARIAFVGFGKDVRTPSLKTIGL
mmetsp:Transcript_47484/g.101568  ORF Transcript_47484/g.101568 Transcript_47484/m.101568 type:complete len:154 (-) Transcript_47484:1221-1682(-)